MSRNDFTIRTRPPFRADVVGSYLRPEPLRKARADHQNGLLTAEELKTAEDIAVRNLIRNQKNAGLFVVTDGEFRRSWWHLDFMWGLDGIAKAESSSDHRFHDHKGRTETARLTGKLRFGNHPFLAHYAFLTGNAGPDVFARQTIPAPAQLLAELCRPENLPSTKEIYPDQQELIDDIAAVYRDAMEAFHGLGCRNLQWDDCTWGLLCDPAYRSAAGVRADQEAEIYLQVNNAALLDRPEGMIITTHVCRGAFRTALTSPVDYSPVARILFTQEKVDAFYLEYDTESPGDFEPLRHVADQVVVLGLISSRMPQAEDEHHICKRIEEAARHMPLDQLCLSPQCGFASVEEGNCLTHEEQWAKVRLVENIARQVWG